MIFYIAYKRKKIRHVAQVKTSLVRAVNFDKLVRYKFIITIVSLLLDFNPMVPFQQIFGDHLGDLSLNNLGVKFIFDL